MFCHSHSSVGQNKGATHVEQTGCVTGVPRLPHLKPSEKWMNHCPVTPESVSNTFLRFHGSKNAIYSRRFPNVTLALRTVLHNSPNCLSFKEQFGLTVGELLLTGSEGGFQMHVSNNSQMLKDLTAWFSSKSVRKCKQAVKSRTILLTKNSIYFYFWATWKWLLFKLWTIAQMYSFQTTNGFIF